MNFIARNTKVFAILLLFFANVSYASAQGGSIYRLPAGTRIRLQMDAGISSKISSVSDTFTATVARPIVVNDVVVLPSGTVIEGRVIEVAGADIGGKNGRLKLRFESMRFADDRKRVIDGILIQELRPRSDTAWKMITIFGGTAAGAAIGAIAGRGNGVLAGAGIGAGAGTAAAFLKKGKDVYIRTDEEFEIELKSEVTLPAREY